MTDRHSTYTELLMRHREMLWRLCWKHSGGDRDRCQDLMQEVSIALWENYDKLHPDASPRQEQAWVRWQARSVFYQIERRHTLSTVPINSSLSDNLADEETHHRKELIDELLSALNPDEQRLVRLYLEGYPGDEIGKTMGVSRDTVYKRLQRIVHKLRHIALLLFALLFTSAIAVVAVPEWRHFFFSIGQEETVTDTVPVLEKHEAPLSDTVPTKAAVQHTARFRPPLEEMPPLDILDLVDIPNEVHPVYSHKDVTVTVSGSRLFITGANGETIKVYDKSGHLVAAQTASTLCVIELFPNIWAYHPYVQTQFKLLIGNRQEMWIQL